jgi:hypothetical protein
VLVLPQVLQAERLVPELPLVLEELLFLPVTHFHHQTVIV